MNQTPVNLDQALLGPKFETQTAQSFRDYVESLKQLKELDKPPRPPRIKREPVFHVATPETAETKMHTCAKCHKRYRSDKAKCPGVVVSKSDAPTDQSVDSEIIVASDPISS